MKTEILTFQVRPSNLFTDFVKADEEVWNPWLKRQRGFLQKTYRVVQRKDHSEVSLLIFWKSPEHLQEASRKTKEINSLDVNLKDKFSGIFSKVHSRVF